MIRAWNRHSEPASQPEVTFRAHHEHFALKNTTFRAPAIIPNFTKYCACHEKWQFNFTKYCACHEKWHFQILHLQRKVTLARRLHQILRLQRKVTLGLHQILRLPRKVTLLLLDSTTTWLYYLTLLLLDSTITWPFFTWLYYYLTLLWLDSTTITLLYYYLTLLLLDSSIT